MAHKRRRAGSKRRPDQTREANGRASRRTADAGHPPNTLGPTPQAQLRRQIAAGITRLSAAEIEVGLAVFVTDGPDAAPARALLRAETSGDPVRTTSTLDLMLTRGLISQEQHAGGCDFARLYHLFYGTGAARASDPQADRVKGTARAGALGAEGLSDEACARLRAKLERLLGRVPGREPVPHELARLGARMSAPAAAELALSSRARSEAKAVCIYDRRPRWVRRCLDPALPYRRSDDADREALLEALDAFAVEFGHAAKGRRERRDERAA